MGKRAMTTNVATAEPPNLVQSAEPNGHRGHALGRRDVSGGRIGVAERPGRADRCITVVAMSGVGPLSAMSWDLAGETAPV
jgi:hypothetical protein